VPIERPEVREAFADRINRFMENVLAEVHALSSGRVAATRKLEGEHRPFHEALIPAPFLLAHDFERSFSTKLGTLVEQCAHDISRAAHILSERSAIVAGSLPLSVSEDIERYVASLRAGAYRGQHKNAAVRFSHWEAGPQTTMIHRRLIIDLRVECEGGDVMLFEIKSPKPNKGQCLEATQRLLLCHAVLRVGFPDLQTYYAMPYNPWGRGRAGYAHSIALNYLDPEGQLLIGEEFWDAIGGPETGAELVKLFEQVGYVW
jgi:hypothetical protein